jgi:hypothetical protein
LVARHRRIERQERSSLAPLLEGVRIFRNGQERETAPNEPLESLDLKKRLLPITLKIKLAF